MTRANRTGDDLLGRPEPGRAPTPAARWTRVLGVAVAVSLLVAGVLAGRVLTPVQPVAGSGSTSTTGHERVQLAIARGQLLFVGASYTVGLGATAPTAGYAPVLAAGLDRRFTLSAVSGTGFLNPGPHGQGTFAQRIARLPGSLDPRIVVIQGGRNDAAYGPQAVQSAARTTITLAQHRFRHAQVVVMGPIPATVPVGPQLLQTRDAVEAAARGCHAGFVDPIAQGWITRGNQQRYAGPVPAHPNDAGYRYIASRLRGDLAAALEQSQPPLDADAAVTVPTAAVAPTTGTAAGPDVRPVSVPR